MEMIVGFPGGARVDAHFGGFEVRTDQPSMGGGEGSAPTPFAVFLASIATCAGIYVLGFCKQRGLPAEGIQVVQRLHSTPASQGLIERIELEIQVPADFPEKYHDALVRSAGMCLVKRHFEKPPEFDIHTAVVS